jgi:ABC-type multidrug transport system fused ATPase/permease subunit
MNEEEYISSRVDDQIGWYDRKSKTAQRWFKWIRSIEIVSAAAIPLIAGFAAEPFPVTLVVGLLGALIAITSSLVSLNQFQENWTEYRTTCESLKHEKFLFLTKAEPYHEDGSYRLFVQRVESLISKENSAWSQYTQAAIEKANVKMERGD